MSKTTILAAALLLGSAVQAQAAVKTETVEYKHGDTPLKGYLAYDDAVQGKRPGVLVVHEWWGLNEHSRSKAEALAKEGYVAFALDMYGEGKNTTHPEQAGEWSGEVGKNREVARARFQAAREVLAKNPRVDPEKIAAIGYCFGGAVVLAMAKSGDDLDGVVSFHGALLPDAVPAGTQVKAKILVCHGADDNFVIPDQLELFQQNLTKAGADWQFITYGGAKHSFTNPGADKAGMPGLAYNEKADRRSWQAMLDFFREIFGS